MARYFTADTHFAHKVITDKYRTQFSCIEEHDNYLFDQMARLKKRDILFVLGDFLFDSPKGTKYDYDYYINQLSKMSCEIRLVMGNHDSKLLYREDRIKGLRIELPLFSYKNMWLSHCPIHPQEIRGKLGSVHGHLHGSKVMRDYGKYETEDERYFNVNLDTNDMKFVDFEEIYDKFAKLSYNKV